MGWPRPPGRVGLDKALHVSHYVARQDLSSKLSLSSPRCDGGGTARHALLSLACSWRPPHARSRGQVPLGNPTLKGYHGHRHGCTTPRGACVSALTSWSRAWFRLSSEPMTGGQARLVGRDRPCRARHPSTTSQPWCVRRPSRWRRTRPPPRGAAPHSCPAKTADHAGVGAPTPTAPAGAAPAAGHAAACGATPSSRIQAPPRAPPSPSTDRPKESSAEGRRRRRNRTQGPQGPRAPRPHAQGHPACTSILPREAQGGSSAGAMVPCSGTRRVLRPGPWGKPWCWRR